MNDQQHDLLNALEDDVSDEFAAGLSRRRVRLTILGLLLFTVVVLGAALLLRAAITRQRQAELAGLTQVAALATEAQATLGAEQTRIAAEQTAEAIAATETAAATITPSVTASRTPDLPPTFTPTPEAQQADTRLYDPPPSDLPGLLYGWGGRTPFNVDFVNLLRLSPGSGAIDQIGSEMVQFVTADGDGTRLAYMRYYPLEAVWTIDSISPADPTASQTLDNQWLSYDLREPLHPRLSFDGRRLVFTGLMADNGTREVFMLDFETGTASRLTMDSANYSFPAASPDGTQVLAVKDDGQGPDLVLLDLRTDPGAPQQNAITADFGALVESAPYWAPDGQQIAYAASSGAGQDRDISIARLLDGRLIGAPARVISSAADESYPVYAPDSQHLAYTSDAAGVFNIFIYQLSTGIIYQLTDAEAATYPGGWTR